MVAVPEKCCCKLVETNRLERADSDAPAALLERPSIKQYTRQIFIMLSFPADASV